MRVNRSFLDKTCNDKELLDLFKIALTPVEAEKVSVGYLIKDNILKKKWSSHHVTIGPLLLLKEKWLDEDPEKISVLKYDTNYLVKTPGGRKETQVYHINMLKAYHEKPKPELVTLNNRLGLESPTDSKDCVGQVAEKEEDT